MKFKNRKTIGVIFGGKSFEHEVSLVSARSIIDNLNKKKYKIILIGINKNGDWLVGEKAKRLLMGRGGDIKLKSKSEKSKIDNRVLKLIEKVDVFFPVLHGVFGEDGTIQGFFEILNKPYIGAGVLGSALGMDKIMQKTIFKTCCLPSAPFIWFLKSEFKFNPQKFVYSIKKKINFPCFVKPANSGSSVGISKVKNDRQLIRAIKTAARYDNKILVEKAIPNVREIEISVLGNDKPLISLPGEIKSSNEFYDYDAKYVDGKSTAIIPAKLKQKIIEQIQKLAIAAYRALDCSGMARIDFLLDDKTKECFLNEINTIPGFTSISMYPKLWQTSGIKFSKLLDMLIQFAITRYDERQRLSTSYQTLNNKWYAQ